VCEKEGRQEEDGKKRGARSQEVCGRGEDGKKKMGDSRGVGSQGLCGRWGKVRRRWESQEELGVKRCLGEGRKVRRRWEEKRLGRSRGVWEREGRQEEDGKKRGAGDPDLCGRGEEVRRRWEVERSRRSRGVWERGGKQERTAWSWLNWSSSKVVAGVRGGGYGGGVDEWGRVYILYIEGKWIWNVLEGEAEVQNV